MPTQKQILSRGLSLLSLLFLLVACGGTDTQTIESADPSTLDPAPGNGLLSVQLTDAPRPADEAVYVTIDEVAVHFADEDEETGFWQTVVSESRTVNLLELVNGVLLDLGLAELPAGHYTQLRLRIGATADATTNILDTYHPVANYVIDADETIHALKVPSNTIKLVKGFEVIDGETTELILDFDAARSVVQAGKSGKWLLKPTIKVLDTRSYAIVNGTVRKDEAPNAVISGAQVQIQTVDEATTDETVAVLTVGATTTDDTGAYRLFADTGAYALVINAIGYQPQCQWIEPVAGTSLSGDVSLVAAVEGVTLSGSVSMPESTEDQVAHVSIRQTLDCSGDDVTVELTRVQVTDGGFFSTFLPAGDYRLISWTADRETRSDTVALVPDTPELIEITLE
ncbi:MAG: hypothetical protein C0618_01960 [Desulfuromonas sp.]|nr:MAG: hypothetical protein C0618_01960 [Desulfuromonas sp.]